VGNHYGLVVGGFCQHRGQPVPAGHVQLDGILGSEVLAMVLDNGEIRHLPPGLLHGEELVCLPEEKKVCPQDAAQESHTIDDNLIIVQHVDIIGCFRLQFIDQGDVVMVELMVTRYVDHRPVREPLPCPAQPFHPDADIARQDHYAGIGCRRREVFELDVQIIEDVEFHILMVVASDSHEHPMRVTRTTLSNVVVQAFPVLIILVSVYGNRMAVAITVRLRGNCRGTPIPTA
jgi:hypothetical protein